MTKDAYLVPTISALLKSVVWKPWLIKALEINISEAIGDDQSPRMIVISINK